MTNLRDEPQRLEVLRHDVAFQGRVWDVVTETVQYGDSTLVRDFMQHPGAAAVVALDDAGRVLVLQQYRHPIRLRDWEIPAGLLDVVGEDPQRAAERELAEEADLAAETWEHLTSIHPSPGGSNEIIHIYLARGLRSVQTDFVREGEEVDMRIEWLPLDEAVGNILSGAFQNGTLAVGVLAAAARLRA